MLFYTDLIKIHKLVKEKYHIFFYIFIHTDQEMSKFDTSMASASAIGTQEEPSDQGTFGFGESSTQEL